MPAVNFIKIFLPAICGTLVFLSAPVFADTAIIPYKIKNPSESLTAETGREYAKLVGIAGLASRTGLKIASPLEIASALKSLRINPQGTITMDGLRRFASGRRHEYILLGTLSRTQSGYVSESVLYSFEQDRVVRRIRKTADSLLRLAQREAEDVFRSYQAVEESRTGNRLDAAFLIDASYRVNPDWPAIKEAVTGFASHTVDRLGMDVKIIGVPFSDKVSFDRAFGAVNSVVDVKNGLDKIRPLGGTSAENFSRSMNYILTSTVWRSDSEKVLIIVANSDPGRVSLLERFGALARRNGIKIYALCLGSLSGDSRQYLRSLTDIGKGEVRDVTYRQRIYDHQAAEIDLYMENGRFFRGRYPSQEWTAGLFRQGGARKPREFLEEIMYSSSKARLEPYRMADQLDRLTGTRVLNREPLENNLPQVMKRIAGAYYKKGKKTGQLPVGRVLVSDGQVSVWITVPDEDSAAFFREKAASRATFPLGVSLGRDEKQAYGLSFRVRVKGIGFEYVPALITVGLNSLIKRSGQYISNGLLSPPVWFIKVRVEEYRKLRSSRDVRSR